ncbi:MAG: hypothetical protein HQ593_06470 [Candidatus Omnitrophica bacterium]|nr:hypothetical protein [Candidatus Omnitrophota bacterium]
MSGKRQTSKLKKRSVLLGVGFDGKDGHTRITKGENFYIFGGSKRTHETMQEKTAKFNEQLKRRRKKLKDITSEEFYEIADRVGLEVPKEARR